MNATPPPLPPQATGKKSKPSFRVFHAMVLFCVALILVELIVLAVRNRPQGPDNIFDAARDGNTRRIAKLLARGALINRHGTEGATPLTQATWGKHPETIEFLIQKGADINERDDKGCTALIWAARSG